jgi:hypothetical protein
LCTSALKTYLKKPFARKDLSNEELVFNYKLLCKEVHLVCLWDLTAKLRLLNRAIETNVDKAERTVKCVCLLHNIITGLEGTTHDPSVLEESLQIHRSCHVINRCQWQSIQSGAIPSLRQHLS